MRNVCEDNTENIQVLKQLELQAIDPETQQQLEQWGFQARIQNSKLVLTRNNNNNVDRGSEGNSDQSNPHL